MSAPRFPPAESGPNTTHALLAQHEPVVDSARRGMTSLLRPEVVERALLDLHRELARLAMLGEAPPARELPAARETVLISVEAREDLSQTDARDLVRDEDGDVVAALEQVYVTAWVDAYRAGRDA